MVLSANAIFWEVDVQNDFMLPEGKLYVPSAEELIPNIDSLTDAARKGQVFLISSADAHNLSDPELRQWPPHCLKGTPGAQLLQEATTSPRLIIPNQEGFALPKNLGAYRQLTLEKNTLDVFDNPNADVLLEKLASSATTPSVPNTQFIVFGVATEYCVRCTADGLLRRGRSVAIVTDAVRAIDQTKGQEVLSGLQSRGARLITTAEALQVVA